MHQFAEQATRKAVDDIKEPPFSIWKNYRSILSSCETYHVHGESKEVGSKCQVGDVANE